MSLQMRTDPFRRQAERLKALKRYPGPEEYERVLKRVAKSPAHAAAIMDRILDSCIECPPPVRILEVAEQTPVPGSVSATRKRGCPLCIEGWRRTYVLRRRHMDDDGNLSWLSEVISEERYNALVATVDNRTQRVYEAREECACTGAAAVA